MDHSFLLARLFGLIFVIAYGGLLLNRKFYKRMIDSMERQPLILVLSGFISLLLGLLVIEFHPLWTPDWRGLITLLGWILIIQGVVRLVFPEFVFKMAHVFIRHIEALYVAALVMFLIGIYLVYMGFSYTEPTSRISSWQEGALNLNQEKPMPKQHNLNKLCDAGIFKDSAKPTLPKTDS